MSKLSRNVLIGFVALTGLAIAGNILKRAGVSPPTQQATPPSTAPVAAKCEKVAGQMWSGARLYSDSSCKNQLGVLLGGSKVGGQKTVRIEYVDGQIDDKLRSTVGQQTYVMTDDPAMSSREWREY